MSDSPGTRPRSEGPAHDVAALAIDASSGPGSGHDSLPPGPSRVRVRVPRRPRRRQTFLRPHRGHLRPQARHGAHARCGQAVQAQRLRRALHGVGRVLLQPRGARWRAQERLAGPGARPRLHGFRRRAWFPAAVRHPGDHRGHPPRRAVRPRALRGARGEVRPPRDLRRERRRPSFADDGDAGRPRKSRRQGPDRSRIERGAGRGMLLPADRLSGLAQHRGRRRGSRHPGQLQAGVRRSQRHGGKPGRLRQGDLADQLHPAGHAADAHHPRGRRQARADPPSGDLLEAMRGRRGEGPGEARPQTRSGPRLGGHRERRGDLRRLVRRASPRTQEVSPGRAAFRSER